MNTHLMDNNAIKLITGEYNRKSTESEDRQVLSLDSQKEKNRETEKAYGLRVSPKHVFSEAKSAKTTNNRAQFAQMIQCLERGEINAIVTWHPDRLSRNAFDTAMLIDQMDRGKLLQIITPSQLFRNTPMDKFMLSLACSQAKMENDKKGIDVKRGLMRKAELGVIPNLAPIGYLNDKFGQKGEKSVQKDPERFDLVRKCWDLALTGTYNPLQIREIATNEWGLRTKNGKKLARSGIYWILTNPFYYGLFEFPKGTGQWWQGTHNPMITVEEYDLVQTRLGRKGKTRPKNHIFEFTGMVRCGECGAMVTAETKTKHQQNGNVHLYVYYHCTKRKNPDCTQGSIEVTEFKRQVTKAINEIEIPPEFHSFAMKWFRAENEREAHEQKTVLGAQQKAYNAAVEKLSNLIDMRAAGEISPEDFAAKQEKYLTEKKRLMSKLTATDDRVEQWNKTSDEMLTFIERAKEKFNTGSFEIKREILSTLGSNLTLKGKILRIDLENSLFPMIELAPEVRKIRGRFEPLDTLEKQMDFEQECTQNPTVLATVDDFRTIDWVTEYPFPNIALREIGELLGV